MKIKPFILFSIFIVIFGFIILTWVFKEKEIAPLNNITVNELVNQTQNNWNHLTTGIYPEKSYDFTVIDLSGKVFYSTMNVPITSYIEQVNRAISNRDTLVDIIVKDQTVGKLIVHNDLYSAIENERHQLKRIAIIVFLLIVFMMLGHFYYIERTFFRPFHKLRRFASGIALGNLDEPMKMDKKNIFGAFTESFDLMREALKTARHNEYLANKSKKELVAALSHDIKNPVASIKAICEIIALKSNDIRITTISQKADQIDCLISDMFQSTLEELGELKVTIEEVSSDILLEVIRNSNDRHNIYSVSELPECLILCDRLRLTQIFDNVVNNVNKYAKTDIHIDFHLTGASLQIEIKDFGQGVHEEDLPLLCEKFYRGKNAEGKEGAGLGLYLSKMFLEKMGGHMECINEKDGFLLRLELRLAGLDDA